MMFDIIWHHLRWYAAATLAGLLIVLAWINGSRNDLRIVTAAKEREREAAARAAETLAAAAAAKSQREKDASLAKEASQKAAEAAAKVISLDQERSVLGERLDAIDDDWARAKGYNDRNSLPMVRASGTSR